MNSAYCLVGAFWDGKPATNELPDIEPFDATAGATSSADSLFDLVCRCRYLRLSDLLSCDSEQELDGLLDGLSGSENVYIALDSLALGKDKRFTSLSPSFHPVTSL